MSNLNDQEMSPLTLVYGDHVNLRPYRVDFCRFPRDEIENFSGPSQAVKSQFGPSSVAAVGFQ